MAAMAVVVVMVATIPSVLYTLLLLLQICMALDADVQSEVPEVVLILQFPVDLIDQLRARLNNR